MKRRKISLVLSESMYEKLCKISKGIDKSKSDIIRDGIKTQLRKYKIYTMDLNNKKPD